MKWVKKIIKFMSSTPEQIAEEVKCPTCGRLQLSIYPFSSYALENKSVIRECIACVKAKKEEAEKIKQQETENVDVNFSLPKTDAQLLEELVTKAMDNDSGGDITRTNKLSFLLGKLVKAQR